MLLTTLLSLVFPVLIAVGGVLLRRARRRRITDRQRGLSDAMIREIERTGRVAWEQDPPLDPERIRDEEERFWRETAWDEPERF